jgi:putative oxidoreductase
MLDLALLLLRLALGSLLAGHGAQKLFGWFDGYGVAGTAGYMESLGLRPGRRWAIAAGLSEFGGGLLTLLGFLNPLGPLGVIGAMLMATAKSIGASRSGSPVVEPSSRSPMPLLPAPSPWPGQALTRSIGCSVSGCRGGSSCQGW